MGKGTMLQTAEAQAINHNKQTAIRRGQSWTGMERQELTVSLYWILLKKRCLGNIMLPANSGGDAG